MYYSINQFAPSETSVVLLYWVVIVKLARPSIVWELVVAMVTVVHESIFLIMYSLPIIPTAEGRVIVVSPETKMILLLSSVVFDEIIDTFLANDPESERVEFGESYYEKNQEE